MHLPLLAACALALLLATGCTKRDASGTPAASANPDASAAAPTTLIIGNGAEPRDLDPHIVTAYTDYNILIALFEGLTVIDEATGRPQPGMAERWDISPDGLEYTFHLRQDAVWSNGDPVVALDFAYAFERILNPAMASEYAYMLAPVKHAAAYAAGTFFDFSEVGVRVLNAKTLRLTLERPTPYLLSLAAHQSWFPVHRATLDKFDARYRRGTAWTRPGNLVGNGPFTLETWEPDRRIVVRKNPRHRDAPANRIDTVVFLPIADAAAEERTFRTGQMHLTYSLPVDRVATYRAQNPSPLRVDPLLETAYLRFNCTRPPLNDPRVRRALSLAVDRRALAESVYRGTRLPAPSLVPPDTASYTSAPRPLSDPAAARALLAEAGFPGGKGFPPVELQFSPQVIETAAVEAMQEMWRRELGVDITLARLEYRVHLDNQNTLGYDLSASRWIGDYIDPATYTDLFIAQSGNNDTGWTSPAYDALTEQASRETDTPARHALLRRAETLLLDEAPIAPLLYGARTYLIDPRVKNWTSNLLGIRRYQTLSLDPAAPPKL